MKIAKPEIIAKGDFFFVEIHGPDITGSLTEQETNINTQRVIVITHNGLYGKRYHLTCRL